MRDDAFTTSKQITYTQENLIKEQLWETEMLRKGRDAYIESLSNQNLSDTDIGLSLSMRMIPVVVSTIEKRQEELTHTLLNSAIKKKTGAAHLLPLCNAELLGVAVVQHFLRAMLTTEDEGELTLRRMLDHMEDAYTEAMGLQMWEQDDTAAYAHFWKKSADKLSTVGNNAKARKAFKVRLKDRLNKYYEDFKEQHDTTQRVQLSVATELLSCVGFTKTRVTTEDKALDVIENQGEDKVMLVDNKFCLVEDLVGPFHDMFILRSGTERSREVRLMYMSEDCAESIDHTIERRAIGNTSLRPMLVKPKRWILTTS